jgi:hypothetical protein
MLKEGPDMWFLRFPQNW